MKKGLRTESYRYLFSVSWDDGKEQQGTVNVDDSSKQLLKKSKDVNVNKVVKLKQSCSRRQESKYQSIKFWDRRVVIVILLQVRPFLMFVLAMSMFCYVIQLVVVLP